MADIFEYLQWRGDLPFEQVPPGPVDALVFSALSYLDYKGLVSEDFRDPVPLKVVADAFLALPDAEDRVRVKKDVDLLASAAQTPRFAPVELMFYRNEFLPEEETQFAAVTFLLPGGGTVVAFRGTDYSLAGWKEDFNMSFQEFVPAQEKALLYTQAYLRVDSGPVWLCGHSKGGNLAVYTAIKCQPAEQSRIREVWNLDGPGFTSATMADPGYREMVPKIHTCVPQSSVVGMLLEHEEPYTVVKSRQVSLLQHELYSWEVMGGDFVRMEEVTDESRFLDKTIKTWLAARSPAQRNEFVDAVFELLSVGEVDDAREIILPRNVMRYLKTLSEDTQMRGLILKEFSDLINTAVRLRREKEPPQLPGGES